MNFSQSSSLTAFIKSYFIALGKRQLGLKFSFLASHQTEKVRAAGELVEVQAYNVKGESLPVYPIA